MNNAALMPSQSSFSVPENWKILNSIIVYVCLIERGAVNEKKTFRCP